MVFKRSTLLWVGALGLLLGVWQAKYTSDVSWALYLVALASIPVVKQKNMGALVAIFICMFSLGLFRAQAWQSSADFAESKVGQQVAIEGRVINDSVFDSRRQTQFEIDRLVLVDGQDKTEIKGLLRVKGFGAPLVLRHDRVVVKGKLSKGFGTRVGSMSFSSIEVVARSGSKVEEFRREFSARLFSEFSDRDASLALGILVGQRTSIDEQDEENLRVVGLTHIIAVSGYNLSIIVRLIRRHLKGLSKFQSLLLSSVLVALFLMIAGASASVVRAAWVIGLSLAAWYFGRNIRPIVLLMLSAAATVWFNPFFIWYDIGWWLSFSAFFGVLMIGPQLQARMFKEKKPNFLVQVAIESFAASVMTAPLIIWVFERVSIVSLLANILVVPIVPIVMVLSFAAGVLAFISRDFLLTKVIVLLSSLSLGYILTLSEKLASIPYVELKASLSTVQLAMAYSFILIITYVLHQKTKLHKPYDLLE